MDQPSPIDLAKQGDASAIAYLIQRTLQNPEIKVKVALRQHQLHIVLASPNPLNKSDIVTLLQRELSDWQIPSIQSARVESWQPGNGHSTWSYAFEVVPSIDEQEVTIEQDSFKPNLHGSGTPQATNLKPQISKRLSQPRSRPPVSKKQDLALLFLEKFNPFKLALLGLLTFHSIFSSTHYTLLGFLEGSDFFMMFLHNVNLIFHEAGHAILMFFGQFIHLVGGSLMQITVPTALCVYFFITQQRYSSAIALWWTGQNFLDVSIYIKDAQERLLPLLGGEASLHDWHFILLDLRLLVYDNIIGNITYGIGILIYVVAIAAGLYHSQNIESHSSSTE
jgi:hypothetical protein